MSEQHEETPPSTPDVPPAEPLPEPAPKEDESEEQPVPGVARSDWVSGYDIPPARGATTA